MSLASRTPLSGLLFALCLGLAPGAATASAGEALQVFLDGTRTLAANFSQQLFDERKLVIEESRGDLLLRRPGEFRWRYVEPFEQLIVSNGERVWIWDADLTQVTIRRAGRSMGGSPALLLTSTRPLAELFELTEVGQRGELDWVELKPLEDGAAFARLRVGMRGERIGAMELVDTFGQTTVLTFRDIDAAPEVPVDAFRFEIPEGADVMDETRAATGG